MQLRNAASVLPEPVGAEINRSPPSRISGHASAWAGVGWPNFCPNQVVVSEQKPFIAFPTVYAVPARRRAGRPERG